MRERVGLPLKRALWHIGVFSAIVNVLTLVMPLYMLQVYDRVLPASSLDTLFYISVIAVVALAVLGFLEAVRALYANRIAARIDAFYGPVLFRASLEGPRAPLGDVAPLRDLSTVRAFIGSRALFFLFDLPFGPFFVALLYFVHPVVFWATVASGVVMILLAWANQWATTRSAHEAMEAQAAAMTSAQTFARNFETVRTLGMVRASGELWGAHFARTLLASDRIMAINSSFGSAVRSIRLLQQVAMYGVGAYLTLIGEMTPGMIFAASMVSARALQPLDQIVASWKQVADSNGAWNRIRRIMAANAETDAARTELEPPRDAVVVENVVYFPPQAREGAQPLIKRINFRVGAGETLAIVGPSQAGKSTVARLLVGAIEARSGFVRLDGADIRTWDRERLGAHLGYLAQEVELFPGTIAQNIARLDPDATSEQVVSAAQRAHVHAMILAQKDGYDTIIGPAGVRLSGGERQRIGLARALYGDPKLIVLDEPNSNLDSDGEAALDRAVQEAKARGAIVVIVTHRPSIAGRCDKVLFLRDGQIEQFGPAQEVLARLAAPPPADRQPKADVVPMSAARAASAGGPPPSA